MRGHSLPGHAVAQLDAHLARLGIYMLAITLEPFIIVRRCI